MANSTDKFKAIMADIAITRLSIQGTTIETFANNIQRLVKEDEPDLEAIEFSLDHIQTVLNKMQAVAKDLKI